MQVVREMLSDTELSDLSERNHEAIHLAGEEAVLYAADARQSREAVGEVLYLPQINGEIIEPETAAIAGKVVSVGEVLEPSTAKAYKR